MKNAFTLVELAIVIVIIGLLVGGVLQGQELVKQARFQSIIKDIEGYKTASYTFKSKYNSIPGDIGNATTFFPAASNCGASNADLGQAACNGNADGVVGPGTNQYEYQYYWKHLELAKLVKGSFTGLPGPQGAMDAIIGVNVPATSIKGVGITIETVTGSVAWLYDGTYNNAYTLGTKNSIWDTSSPFMNPQDAYAFDLKYDDGLPGLGKIRPKILANCSTGNNTQASTAVYNMAYTKDDACGFFINSDF